MTRNVPLRGVFLATTVFAAGTVAWAQAPQPPAALPSPLPLFPPDNWWNADVSAAPVDPNSATFINGSAVGGPGRTVHPDFGGDVNPFPDIYGMVYAVVPGTTPLEVVDFTSYGYPDESDVGAPGRPPGYPIPVGARTQPKWIEGGQAGGCNDSDCHMLLVDYDNRILFELYQAFWNPGLARWQAGSGAIFPLDSNLRRPDGWTSADAAGLAILPGLVRYDEVFGPNPIKHAFRMTVSSTNGYVFPASHRAGSTAGALPMGARLRLKAATPMPANAQLAKIYQAMKTYGLIVADNGSNMYVTGAYDPRWTSPVVQGSWPGITASDFEVVQLGWKPSTSPPVLNLKFYTLTPCRLVDTRTASGPYGGPALPPGGERVFTAIGRCGIPATAKAISINAAVVVAGAQGNLTFYPGDLSAPLASNINFAPGQTRANNAIVKLAGSGSGAFAVRQVTNPSASLNLLVDVNGYFE